MFMFFVGLVVTMLGVGGIEHSMTDRELMNAGAVAVVGLLITAVGTLMTIADNNP
jgi:hypothetical protein